MASKDMITLNTNSPKIRFATIFMKSFLKMKKLRSDEDMHRRRSRKIKMVAYWSMARAVGSKRAWSRALIFKLRTRASHRRLLTRKRCLAKTKPSRKLGRANRLRRLVPGGEAMDICSLLEETAHYIKCLTTQVKVMQSIADHFST